ncbi:GerAB/ArcD/ProY family transporter [Bacillus thuringiensis]|uniref:GerAB/ArcD/ProY family transporter n=1 Tax=Bacillus thuringiensis TaxID=1428 RepID=UPI00041D0734|nr:GerAB/ArcD/ProY family transporter [Bacillus thuringiensis]
MNKNIRINYTQLILLIIGNQLGLIVYVLPSAITILAQGSSWLAIVLAGVGGSICASLMHMLHKQFSNQMFFDYIHVLTGKPLGICIILSYTLYFILLATQFVVTFQYVINDWILLLTPKGVIIFLTLLPCYLLIKRSINTIVRFCSIVISTSLFIYIIYFIFIFIYYTQYDFDLLRFIPIMQTNGKQLLLAVHQAFTYISGFSILLFILPFVTGESKRVWRYVLFGNGITVIFCIILIITINLFQSIQETMMIQYPWLYLLRGMSYTALSGFDLLFIPFSLGSYIVSLTLTLYMASIGVKNLSNNISQPKIAFLISCLVITLAMYPVNQYIFQRFSFYFSWITYLFVFIIPLLLLILAKIKKTFRGE